MSPEEILELARKCHPRGRSPAELEPLTWIERKEIAEVLSAHAIERLTPRKPKHRLREDADREFFCVLRMVLDEPGPGAREAARLEFGYTERQMKEAIRVFRADAESIAITNASTPSDRRALKIVCDWHRDRK